MIDWLNYFIGIVLIIRLSALKFPLSPIAGFIGLITIIKLLGGETGGARKEIRDSGGGGGGGD